MHKKIPKICTGCRVSEAKIYLYLSTEIAKARPHSEEWQTDTSVQKQWSMHQPTMGRRKGGRNLNGLDLRSRKANKSFDFFLEMMFF